MLRGRFAEYLNRNLFWIAGLIVLAWLWAMYRYSYASFIPLPELGLVVPTNTKFGIRYISKLDHWIFIASGLGIIFLAGWSLFQRLSRRK